MRKEDYFKMKIKRNTSSAQRAFDRKADARKKIQLGGLFIKAGLEHMHPEEAYVLYGMLLDCKRALQVKPEVKARWARMGRDLLLTDDKRDFPSSISLEDKYK